MQHLIVGRRSPASALSSDGFFTTGGSEDGSGSSNANAFLADHGPIQVHGVGKVPARRAPNLGEHADEILSEFGFDFKGIEGLRPRGAASKAKVRAA
jgi:crotonobetainyl-CoA:carnitine CoA-transferase CaiB-like acyl-CoA transferase